MSDLYESLCQEFEVDPSSAWGSICGQFLVRGMAEARREALEEAYDAMFDINGCKVTRFNAQTAIRSLKERSKGV